MFSLVSIIYIGYLYISKIPLLCVALYGNYYFLICVGSYLIVCIVSCCCCNLFFTLFARSNVYVPSPRTAKVQYVMTLFTVQWSASCVCFSLAPTRDFKLRHAWNIGLHFCFLEGITSHFCAMNCAVKLCKLSRVIQYNPAIGLS